MSKVSVIVPVYNVENYIRDMLTSVQNQTFKDFEVIIVNDGSPDNSQAIIDEFCAADKRFKSFVQENGGVAAARNLGLEKASGEYVVFYDPDDYIPDNSLAKMYAAAVKNNAEIVIGIMQEKSLGESSIYMHSQQLSKKKDIKPWDVNFIGAWSLCNKMFSLNFIKENDLKFEKLYNAEDGVFSFCALNHASRICGCNVISYNYVRRSFWEGSSATQIVNCEYFMGLLKSHDRIIEEVTKLSMKIEDEKQKKEYLEELYFRFIDIEMLNAYYRLLWKAEGGLLELLLERVEKYRTYISDGKWQQLMKRHKDIRLEDGFQTVEQMAQEPKVSLLIDYDGSADKINLILGSIYNQMFPMFEVIVPQRVYDKADEAYRAKLNMHAVSSEGLQFRYDALEMSKGDFVIFMDQFAMFTKQSLKQMVTKLMDNKNLDFVSMLMKHYDGDQFSQIPCLNGAYGYTKKSKSSYDEITKCDTLFSNKLFRKSVIAGFEFSSDPADDVRKLFSSLKFEKVRKGIMITDMTQEDILIRSGCQISETAIRRASAKNERIYRLIEGMKRHINKDDVKRIKEILHRRR